MMRGLTLGAGLVLLVHGLIHLMGMTVYMRLGEIDGMEYKTTLLDGMLQNWSTGRIAAIERQTSLDGATARERLRALVALYSERMNTEGMAVELAIRQWARSDEAAAAAVASVDAARLQNVGQLYRAAGLAAEEADAQAFLFYCFIFGQSLLFLERGPRKRAQLIAKSAEKLLSEEG